MYSSNTAYILSYNMCDNMIYCVLLKHITKHDYSIVKLHIIIRLQI